LVLSSSLRISRFLSRFLLKSRIVSPSTPAVSRPWFVLTEWCATLSHTSLQSRL
jgi:hypothetical protein